MCSLLQCWQRECSTLLSDVVGKIPRFYLQASRFKPTTKEAIYITEGYSRKTNGRKHHTRTFWSRSKLISSPISLSPSLKGFFFLLECIISVRHSMRRGKGRVWLTVRGTHISTYCANAPRIRCMGARLI